MALSKKWLIVSVLLICSCFLTYQVIAYEGVGFSGFGRSVLMNLAFHIASRTGDVFNSSNEYVLSQNNNVTLALISAGSQSFGSRINETYSANDYLFEMKQGIEGNRFLLVFTKGNWQTIKNKIPVVNEDKILTKTFGDLDYSVPDTFPLSLRLEYTDIDIINRTVWSGSGELIIKNQGLNARGIPTISIDVLR